MHNLKRLLFLSIVAFMCMAGRVHAGPIASLSGSIGTSDLDEPSPIGFGFGLPTDTFPLMGIFELMLNWSVLLTDGGSDGVSMTQWTSAGAVQLTVNDIVVADSGWPVFLAGPNGPFTLYSLLNSADFGGQIESVMVGISFNGSGGGDSYTFSGELTLNEVPVPATIVLLLTGLAGLGLWTRMPSKPGPARRHSRS